VIAAGSEEVQDRRPARERSKFIILHRPVGGGGKLRKERRSGQQKRKH